MIHLFSKGEVEGKIGEKWFFKCVIYGNQQEGIK